MEPDVILKLSFGSNNLLIMINNNNNNNNKNNIPWKGKVFILFFFSKNKLNVYTLSISSHILKNDYSTSLINIFLLNKKTKSKQN